VERYATDHERLVESDEIRITAENITGKLEDPTFAQAMRHVVLFID